MPSYCNLLLDDISSMPEQKKKVTKIIRKDGISYRPAGGSIISSIEDADRVIEATSSQPTKTQAKKKQLGRVIKRADGSTIVVVNGKIVKTLKPAVSKNDSFKQSQSNDPKNSNKLGNIQISADELSPDELPIEEISPQSSKVHIDGALSRNESPIVSPEQNCPQITDKTEIKSDDKNDKVNCEFDKHTLIDQRPEKRNLPLQEMQSHNDKKRPSSMSRTLSEADEIKKGVSTSYSSSGKLERSPDRYSSSKQGSHSRKALKSSSENPREKSSDQSLSRKHITHSRLSKRYHEKSERRYVRSSPYKERSSRRMLAEKESRHLKSLKEDRKDGINSLYSYDISLGSKEEILDLIQKQAEEMLQAQNSDPIDPIKRLKLREAMESILAKRGLIKEEIDSHKQKKGYDRSSDSSEGHESPVLEKLHKKYRDQDSLKRFDTPCIDNISVASNDQKISDVSHSDMELSEEEPDKNNEDGKTPSFRKVLTESSMTQPVRHQSSSKIHIKFGKDSEDGAFQDLASKLEELKNSSDVKNLIEAIEGKIKSFVVMNLEPTLLEKKIRKYQALVAKVVIRAEQIKESEEGDMITYHKCTKVKETVVTSSKKNTELPVQYPLQISETNKPWLYPNQQDLPSTSRIEDTSHSNPNEESLTIIPNKDDSDPYQIVKDNYISQRPGYHVCLLCMIESSNESQFLKHLDGKKHIDAVNNKVKQMNRPANSKKYKKLQDVVIQCKLCDTTCVGQKKYNEHVNHRSHQALVQAYVRIGRVVPEPQIVHDHEDDKKHQIDEIQDSGTPAVGREFMSVKSVLDCDDNIIDVYYCSLCKCTCNSEVQVEKHVRSKKHYVVYVKSTRPEFNIPVNVGEHKKRRETTKKIVSAMKTVRQMEEAFQSNKDEYRPVDVGNELHEYNLKAKYADSRSDAIPLQSDISAGVPQFRGLDQGEDGIPLHEDIPPINDSVTPENLNHSRNHIPFQSPYPVATSAYTSYPHAKMFPHESDKKKVYQWELEKQPNETRPQQAFRSPFKIPQKDILSGYRIDNPENQMPYGYFSAPHSANSQQPGDFFYDPTVSDMNRTHGWQPKNVKSSQSDKFGRSFLFDEDIQNDNQWTNTGSSDLPHAEMCNTANYQQPSNEEQFQRVTFQSYPSSSDNGGFATQNDERHNVAPLEPPTSTISQYHNRTPQQSESRGTYSSVYSSLKKAFNDPAIAHNQQRSQTTYSGKATYSGVYSNIQRG